MSLKTALIGIGAALALGISNLTAGATPAQPGALKAVADTPSNVLLARHGGGFGGGGFGHGGFGHGGFGHAGFGHFHGGLHITTTETSSLASPSTATLMVRPAGGATDGTARCVTIIDGLKQGTPKTTAVQSAGDRGPAVPFTRQRAIRQGRLAGGPPAQASTLGQ